MKLITIVYHERGYSSPFYATTEASSAELIATVRRWVKGIRLSAVGAHSRIFGLRVKISAHPCK